MVFLSEIRNIPIEQILTHSSEHKSFERSIQNLFNLRQSKQFRFGEQETQLDFGEQGQSVLSAKVRCLHKTETNALALKYLSDFNKVFE